MHSVTVMELDIRTVEAKLLNVEFNTISKNGKSKVWTTFLEVVDATTSISAGFVKCRECNDLKPFN